MSKEVFIDLILAIRKQLSWQLSWLSKLEQALGGVILDEPADAITDMIDAIEKSFDTTPWPDEFYEEIFQPDDSKINLDLLYNKIIELKIDKK